MTCLCEASQKHQTIEACIKDALEYKGADWKQKALAALRAAAHRRFKRYVSIATVGDRIRWAREAGGIRQKDLAVRIEVPVTTLAQYERGEASMPIHLVRPIAIAARVTPEWLVMASDEGGPPPVPNVVLRKEWSKKRQAQEKAARKWRKKRKRLAPLTPLPPKCKS